MSSSAAPARGASRPTSRRPTQEGSAASGIGGSQTDNSALLAGAAYVFVRSGASWTQQAYLKASNTDARDRFGKRVAIEGDAIVVSAPGEESSATGVDGNQSDNSGTSPGAVYLFGRSDASWSQRAYLKHSAAAGDGGFGASVGISDGSVVAGGPANLTFDGGTVQVTR